MSGMALLQHPTAERKHLDTMLRAAPYRGETSFVHVETGFVAGIQRRPSDDPWVDAGRWMEGDLLVLTVGATHGTSGVQVSDRAAASVSDAFARGGLRGVQALAGAFVAIIVQKSARRVTAIHGPDYERSLFWRVEGASVALASEAKQLVASPMTPPRVDLDALLDGVGARDPLLASPTRTSYEGINRLLPGTSWDNAFGLDLGSTTRVVGSAHISLREGLSEFRRLLGEAVARRLRRGTGLLLSGGLDSTAIAAFAAPLHRRLYGEPLPVLSAGYPRWPSADETKFVSAVAQALGCHVTWTSPEPRPMDALETEVRLHDGALFAPGISNFRQILSAARATGLRSLMDGHDGDAAFGMVERAPSSLLRRRRVRLFTRYLGFRRRRRAEAGVAQGLWAYLRSQFLDLAPWIRRAWRSRVLPQPLPVPMWARGDLRERLATRAMARSWEEARRLQIQLISPLLEVVEREAFDCGLSVLHPLCDGDLLNFLVSLPVEVTLGMGAPKSLVRRGCPEIPSSVRRRVRKTLFDDPYVAGVDAATVSQRINETPRLLPGVDWESFRHWALNTVTSASDYMLVARVLKADRFLANNRC